MAMKELGELFLVREKELPGYIPHILPYITTVLTKIHDGSHKEEDVVAKMLDGRCHTWVTLKDNKVTGFILTQILQYPQYRTLSFWIGSGDVMYTEDKLEQIEGWAKKKFECKMLETWVRPGLAKHMVKEFKCKRRETRCTREIK